MARILFVKPKSQVNTKTEQPPLELLQVAGYLKKNGHQVSLVDFSMENKKENKFDFTGYDYIFLALYMFNRKKAIKLAKVIKKTKKEITIIAGTIMCNDSYCTTMWKQVLQNFPEIDICVIGEPEEAALEIVNGKSLMDIDGIAYRKSGEIKLTKSRMLEENLDKFGLPAWDIVDFKAYGSNLNENCNGIDLSKEILVPVRFSRGCTGSCKYCALWWMWKKWRTRSAHNMVEEIVLLYNKYGIKSFDFRDDCFGVNKEEIIKFCDELKSHNLKIAFSISSRVDVLNDELILRKLREVGCYRILYGVESGSQKILDEYNKGLSIETSKETLALIKKLGYKVHALLVIGAPNENMETINETVDFLNDVKADSISAIGGIILTPGTAYYSIAISAGYINDKCWLANGNLVIDYSHNSRFKIFSYCNAIRSRKRILRERDIYSLKNIIKYFVIRFLQFLKLENFASKILVKVNSFKFLNFRFY